MVSGWKAVFVSALLLAAAVGLQGMNVENIPVLGFINRQMGPLIPLLISLLGLVAAGAAVVASEERGIIKTIAGVAVGGLHVLLIVSLVTKLGPVHYN